MQVEYDVAEADLLALTLSGLRRSGKGRKMIRSRRLAYLMGFAMLALGSWLLIRKLMLPIIFAAMGIVVAALYPLYWGWMVRRRVSAAYHAPQNQASFAQRTLRADDGGLAELSALGELKVKWEAIDDLTEEQGRAYISVQGKPSLVIPADRITSGDYRAFVEACRERMGRKGTGQQADK
jgi:hypothetical protein